ncbi:MAG: murf: udp-n-acetylmuramoyl-tripeptide--d-alanyl-d-alanine ligase [Phycisphaerales bacterium]|nr:murf: udp-n-acetylmuramoyl-tripeptide--d-alanyl-d-alanine ligase [Phycisphaerales bacterium]
MTPLTANEIAEAAGGEVVAGDGSAVVDRVSTDSRTASGGCVFVALRGDNFDGHDYLKEVSAKGVSVVIVHGDVSQQSRDALSASASVAVVRVADTRRALGKLAQVVRRSITRPKVIAIAGSNGKTSTKNALHAVLSQSLRGTASPKSFNNDIGVPATLFPVSAEDDYVILEIGTNHPGEVEHLSRMSEPDVAVITSIGEEHLEFFGTLDAVRKENAAIATGLRPGGLLVTCDDAGLAAVLDHSGPRITFAAAENVRVTLDGTSFDYDGTRFTLPAIGAHFATNALAIIAVARHLGLSDAQIQNGLATADASDMRMQRRDLGGITLLNDAYNANPTSMRAALDTLRQVEWPGRRVVVLADMKELGDHSPAAHAAMADAVNALRPDAAFAVGPTWEAPSHAIEGCRWFADSETAAGVIAESVRDGDLVLLKGSRSMKLERVADAIAAQHPGRPA